MSDSQEDRELLFTVSTVWREERVSCPHPDILRAWMAGGLDEAAAEFVAFHLDESRCPYCNAVVDDLKAGEKAAADESDLEELRSRLLRSTAIALGRASGQ